VNISKKHRAKIREVIDRASPCREAEILAFFEERLRPTLTELDSHLTELLGEAMDKFSIRLPTS
jgi:hypothetical protein